MTNVNKWSRTAATNSTVDSPINWAEGQNPSTVNDSARSVMAAVAADRDDTRGQLTSAGGTTAYTLTTNSVNATLQNGLEVSFKVNATSTGSVTLNVDGLGARKVYDNGSSVSTQIGSGGFTINAHVTVQYDSAADTGVGGWIVTSNPGAASTAGFATTTGGAWAAEATVASAATTDILAASSYFIAISGTATITSLGTGINRVRFVRATGAFTLTHNATTLILPGAANITCASGDTFIVESDASSNVRVMSFQRASGADLKAFTGDSGSGGALGLVPAPAAGDAAANKSLSADGTWKTATGAADYQVFTASGTWTKPTGLSGNEMVVVEMWGGGGAGGSTATTMGGGGGGSYNRSEFRAGDLSATEAVTVGGGGAAVTGTAVGIAGTSSSFKGVLAGGGGGGSGAGGGGGGGVGGDGAVSVGGQPTVAAGALGGATGATTGVGAPGYHYGGAAGGSQTVAGVGGAAVFGGAGGGGKTAAAANAGGASIRGGAGGASNAAGAGTAGTAPGGGGGAGTTAGSGAGARGEVHVWTYKVA